MHNKLPPRMCLVVLLLATSGCGRLGNPPATPTEVTAHTSAVAELQVESDSATGWPSSVDCDGALWAGVALAAGDSAVQLRDALQPDGRPTRRPGADCLPAPSPAPNSAASISTDALTGLILGFTTAHDRDSLVRLQAYAETHAGIVGTPVTAISYVWMKPGTRTLLARAVVASGGLGAEPWLSLPEIWLPVTDDSSFHLQLLALLIEKEAGMWEGEDQLVADAMADASPNDALALAVAGRLAQAEARLVDPTWVPPSYVRGAPTYALAHRALVWSLVAASAGANNE